MSLCLSLCVFISLSLSVCLSVSLSLSLCFSLSLSLSLLSLCLCLSISVSLSVCQSVYVSVCLHPSFPPSLFRSPSSLPYPLPPSLSPLSSLRLFVQSVLMPAVCFVRRPLFCLSVRSFVSFPSVRSMFLLRADLSLGVDSKRVLPC